MSSPLALPYTHYMFVTLVFILFIHFLILVESHSNVMDKRTFENIVAMFQRKSQRQVALFFYCGHSVQVLTFSRHIIDIRLISAIGFITGTLLNWFFCPVCQLYPQNSLCDHIPLKENLSTLQVTQHVKVLIVKVPRL